jgi:Tfp pilus assembly protein PilF
MAAYAQSGSDTADLLLQRAHKAMAAKDLKAAGKMVNAAIAFMPDCAEVWNARATLRYLDGDTDGAMADIAETLKREPRHLGALVGMARILESRDKDDDALKVYMRVLAIAPHWRSAEDAKAGLKAKIAGQNL